MARPKKHEERSTLNRERVLRAAIALADAQGLGALTMRALGDALGVQAMSLYNHIADKDDLLDAMVDLVVGEIAVPSAADPWKLAMAKRARSAHAVLLSHPWACSQLMSRVNVGPNMLRYVDATIVSLQGAGFPLPLVDHVWNACDSYIYGFTLLKLNFPFKTGEYRHVAAAYLPTLSQARYPGMHAMTTAVAEGHHDGLHELDFGLTLLLDGLAQSLTDEAATRTG